MLIKIDIILLKRKDIFFNLSILLLGSPISYRSSPTSSFERDLERERQRLESEKVCFILAISVAFSSMLTTYKSASFNIKTKTS